MREKDTQTPKTQPSGQRTEVDLPQSHARARTEVDLSPAPARAHKPKQTAEMRAGHRLAEPEADPVRDLVTTLDLNHPGDDGTSSVSPEASTMDGQPLLPPTGAMPAVRPERERLGTPAPFSPVTVEDVVITPLPRSAPGPRVPRTGIMVSVTPEPQPSAEEGPAQEETPAPKSRRTRSLVPPPSEPPVQQSAAPLKPEAAPEPSMEPVRGGSVSTANGSGVSAQLLLAQQAATQGHSRSPDHSKTLADDEDFRSTIPQIKSVVPVKARHTGEHGLVSSNTMEHGETVHEIAPVAAAAHDIMELPLESVAERIVALSEPDGAFLTQFRILKRSMEQILEQLGYRTVVVTSSVPREGRTTTALNLAVVMSENPWLKIAVVDLHLRAPSLGRMLKLSHEAPGLLQVLGGEAPMERVLHKLEHRNLYFLPSGGRTDASLRVLNSPQFDVMLDRLRDLFDLVIIDAPPLLDQDDALVIHDKVDGMLFVLRAEYTELKEVNRALERVGRDRLLGVVLNDVRPEEVG